MNQTEFVIKTQTGAYDIEAYVRRIGQDFVVAIWGGDRPHIGAVAIAQPRPSLKDPKAVSASASVICVLGHKEDELAKAVSEILSAGLNAVVTVVAGIHWDNISAEGIRQVIKNSERLTDMILEAMMGDNG
ncbi:MAG: hypothetical protein AB1659_03490 [Thermodesulfobacteriota bacterium]